MFKLCELPLERRPEPFFSLSKVIEEAMNEAALKGNPEEKEQVFYQFADENGESIFSEEPITDYREALVKGKELAVNNECKIYLLKAVAVLTPPQGEVTVTLI